MVQGDSGGWSAQRSLPIRRRRGRRARKAREYSMQMPAQSFFSGRHDRVLCRSLSSSPSFPPFSPGIFLSFFLRSLHPRLLRVEARIRAARYAPSRRRPVGERLPTCTRVISHSPPEGYRIWIYLSPRFILARITLSHTHILIHTSDLPVIICAVPRVPPRAARFCIFNVSVGIRDAHRLTPHSRISRGFRDMHQNGCTGRSVGPPRPASLGVSCYRVYTRIG